MEEKTLNNKCCPEFHGEKWDEKEFNWDNRKFIKASVPTIFHIPFPPMIGRNVTKMTKMAEDSGKLDPDMEDTLLLFNDPSPFKSDMYLSVTGDVPGANNAQISGVFMTKVFDGPYNAIPKFIKEMNKYLEAKGKKAKDYYVHYAYCPKCAKKYGHNHMILFAEV